MTFEELQTILCEIEVAVNNRPLAYASEDDLDEALTPFHLMYGRSFSTRKQFNSVDCVSISSLKSCKQRLFHLRKVLKDFWKRFRTSYLNELHQTNLYQRVKGNNTNNQGRRAHSAYAVEDGKSVTACERRRRISSRCEIEGAFEGGETVICTSTCSGIDPI